MSANIATRFFALVACTNFLAAIFAQPSFAQVGEYCQFERGAIAVKENLRAAVFQDTNKSPNLEATKTKKGGTLCHLFLF